MGFGMMPVFGLLRRKPEAGHDVSESDSVDRPDESRVIGEWNALQYSCA